MNPNTLRPTVKTGNADRRQAPLPRPPAASGDPALVLRHDQAGNISELSTLTISPPRHDCTVLAAMIGSA